MKVFEHMQLGGIDLQNRIGVPAMCTYLVKTKDGVGNLQHVAHYATLAQGKPGFIVQEATAVNINGFISDACLGIYTPRQRQILKEIVDVVHAHDVKFGIQLNHAGMKNISGSPVFGPMDKSGVTGLSKQQINEILTNFEFSSKWARELGYDFVEVHAAHGYLINQFLSPLTNQRDDEYGQDRTLFLRQVIESCREIFEKEVIVRISAEEYDELGLHICDMEPIVRCIEEAGSAAISVSSGGLNKTKINAYPMYQIPYAKAIKAFTHLPVMGVGLITKKQEIEQIIKAEDCDIVLLGRMMARDPFFLLKWKDELGKLKQDDVGEYMYRAIHTQ